MTMNPNKTSSFGASPARRAATLVVVASLCAPFAAPAPAAAQVAVLDNSVLVKMKDSLSTVQSQLGQLQQITGIAGKMQQAIGSFGSGSITGILSGLLGLTGSFTNILNGLKPSIGSSSSFSSSLKGNSTFTSSLGQLSSLFNNAGTSIGSTKDQIQKTLYLSGGSGVTQSQAEGMTAVRAANTREAAANAMATGLQGRVNVANNNQQDMNKLAQSAKSAQDLRGDIAANNAIMLKVLEQMQQMNAQLSSLLHLQGASAIQNDSVQSSASSSSVP